MATVEKSIEVEVSLHTAYNQWTQFEDFPRFMEGVCEVKQLDDKRLFWHTEIGGKDKEWEAEITSQVPDQRIAWRSVAGVENAGIVTFHPIDDGKTRIDLRIEYEPEGIWESIGSALGSVSSRVEGDLERFKDFIEQRGTETGAWRGQIHGGDVSGKGSTLSGLGSLGSSSGNAGGSSVGGSSSSSVGGSSNLGGSSNPGGSSDLGSSSSLGGSMSPGNTGNFGGSSNLGGSSNVGGTSNLGSPDMGGTSHLGGVSSPGGSLRNGIPPSGNTGMSERGDLGRDSSDDLGDDADLRTRTP